MSETQQPAPSEAELARLAQDIEHYVRRPRRPNGRGPSETDAQRLIRDLMEPRLI